ncbi:MAG: GNAT family N-acetyltransferase [Candidatus Bathyarchaeota archaeon]|nr:GNAT family N-acetyltransferase [Candidatus Bathyarchaeota archaeon]
MKPVMRRYQSEEDFWRIKDFLREVFRLNEFTERSWPVQRLDYWRWHEAARSHELKDSVFIWENEGNEVVAVLNPETKVEAHIQIHPDHKTSELEEEMINIALTHLAGDSPEGVRLRVWAPEDDSTRKRLLMEKGFEKKDYAENQYTWLIPDEPSEPTIPEGFKLRPLGDVEELPARSWLSWRAFQPDSPDEDYEGWEWYFGIQRCPLYRRDLEIVAEAPNGYLAAFCTVWYDDVTRTGYFEPVGADPEYRRKGLGKAVIMEGLRRLKKVGATRAMVGGYSEAAKALYSSVAQTEPKLFEPWVKLL